jgi:hypothetical protein
VRSLRNLIELSILPPRCAFCGSDAARKVEEEF